MDLGFGNTNQKIGTATANALLQTANAQEAVIEDEISRYDALLDDDDALATLRAKRIEEMKYAEQRRRENMSITGHGRYEELGDGPTNDTRDVAKEFFMASKQSDRMIVHFYRSSTRLCDIFHRHLSMLAPKHVETRFVKINVEGCDREGGGGGASFLVERLGIVIMPTILIIKNRQAVHHIRGFDELGGTENFSIRTLSRVLSRHGAIQLNDDDDDDDEEDDVEANAFATNRRGMGSSGWIGR